VVLHLNHALKAYPLAGVPCIYGWDLVRPRGPIPEHPAPASRSGQDS
ncbi:uncharacterized protein METZ01_LOCUS391275, partial [marine metagenome]